MKKSKIWTRYNYNLDRVYVRETIGERLRELREQRELTQTEFAKQINYTRNTVGRWERNAQDLTSTQIEYLCKFFEISSDTLIYGTRHEDVEISAVTGLNNSSINWLKNVKNLSPELMDVINKVLGNTDIATLLFECIYIYAKLEIPKSIVTEQDGLLGRVSTYLSDEEALLTSAMTEQLAEILTKIRNNYSGERFTQTENNVQIAIEKFSKAMNELKRDNIDYINSSCSEENCYDDKF